MPKRTYLTLAVVAASFLLLSGASYAHEESQGMGMSSDMKECMTMSKTGNADEDFMRNMIPHHQMAIDMAEKELKKGKDSEARDMAEKVIKAQNKEIKAMESWLKNREKSK